jgi:hypothetical protein
LFTGVVLKAIGCSRRDVLGGIGRLLELIARFVRGRSQSIARALLHVGSGIGHLVLQVLRGTRTLVLRRSFVLV